MEQFLAILVVLVVAAAFYGISYLRKKRLYPTCDQFARRYCEIADRLLADVDEPVNLQVVTLDGGLCQLKPLEQQSKAAQAAK